METRFRNINIELSSACNFDCGYCPEHRLTRKKQLIDYDLVIRLIDDIRRIRLTEEINFYVMGESLLHKRALDIVRYAKQKGLRVKLNTNGSLLDRAMRKELLSIGIDNLFISYHDSYVRYHKYVTVKPRITFEEWHDNIRSTVEDKYAYASPTTVTIILFKSVKALSRERVRDIRVHENEEEVAEALGVWLELGKSIAGRYSVPYLFGAARSGGMRRLFDKAFDRIDKMYTIIPGYRVNLIKVHTWGNSIVSDPGAKVKKAFVGSCDALRDSMAILADGSYSLCCADYDGKVVIGNAHTEPLEELMRSEKVRAIREGFARGKLPFEYCRICRGGRTYGTWLFNQCHSLMMYNSNAYRRLRGMQPIEGNIL